MSGNPDYDTVLKVVSSWPTQDRRLLAMDLLRTLPQQPARLPAPRHTLQRALGLGRASDAPPSDGEVVEWLDEARTEKYGR